MSRVVGEAPHRLERPLEHLYLLVELLSQHLGQPSNTRLRPRGAFDHGRGSGGGANSEGCAAAARFRISATSCLMPAVSVR